MNSKLIKNILIYINEPLEEMLVGRSTNLAYITACIAKNYQVYVHNLPIIGEIIPENLTAEISVIHLNQYNASILIAEYKKQNQLLKNLIDTNASLEALLKLPKKKVVEIGLEFNQKKIKLSEIDFIIQRLEPMKSPFPPFGNYKVDDILQKIKNLFPEYFVFNCPIGKEDKILPLRLNEQYPLAVSTAKSTLESDQLLELVNQQLSEYKKLFPENKNPKIVLKPDNSAQGIGIFALEISKDGMDLERIKQMTIAELSRVQLYNLQSDLKDEMQKIIQILCFVQSCRTNKINDQSQKISEISHQQVLEIAQNLYNQQLLIQPFLEGIKFGDVRVNFAKNVDGNFAVVGATLRRSVAGKFDFTTSLTAEQSVLQPIESLNQEIIFDLIKKINFIIESLNIFFKSEYQNCTELGGDFILVGNDKDILLGEINHHCPAVIPQGEAIMQYSLNNSNFYTQVNAELPKKYDGGIAIVANIIDNQILLQQAKYDARRAD